GCTATTVVIPQANGGKFVAMTHYPPCSEQGNTAHLDGMIQDGLRNRSSTEAPTVVIREPGGWVETGFGGWRESEPGSSEMSRAIASTLRERLGPDVEIRYSPYSEMPIFGAKNETTFIVRVPSSPRRAVEWSSGEYEIGEIGTNKPTLLERLGERAAARFPGVVRHFSDRPRSNVANLIDSILKRTPES
ncbi:MAG: hypothetical protein K2Z81_04420, partial [Cyanobacteria bacterium]|nr:hypothetical protein [Cyanobacteriota bacterium]